MTKIKISDFFEYFEEHHEYFKTLVKHSNIVVIDNENSEVETACVRLNEAQDKIVFEINAEFWEEDLSFLVDKVFLIAHEMSHIIFDHLYKIIEFKDDPQKIKVMNVAMDLFINQFISMIFKIKREGLCDRLGNDGCWVDTVFSESTLKLLGGNKTLNDIELHRGTDYYFNELSILSETSEGQFVLDGLYKLVHNPFDASKSSEDLMDKGKSMGFDMTVEEFSEEQLASDISDKSVENKSILAAGNNAFGRSIETTVDIVRKRPWESVIRKWCRSKIVSKRKTVDRWGFTSRRLNEFQMKGDLILPGDLTFIQKDRSKEKNNIAMFLDISGSCVHLASRFKSAAAAIPPDHFNIHLATFDTQVYKVFDDRDGKRKPSEWDIRGGGGTAFGPIETYLQELDSYPDAVFVVTDGYGTSINPEHPDRFYWFLSEDYKEYIPTESKAYDLNDYA